MLIQPYNSEWIKQFKEIEKIISSSLVDIHTSFEHIGGTSIKDLSSKPIIDIDLIYYKTNDFSKIKHILESIGYYHNGDQGISGREVFKRKKNNSHFILDNITHHLYACCFDNDELKRHILFRDYLRINPKARLEYEKLKIEIATECNHDKKKYANLKEIKAKSFIESVIENAKLHLKVA